jgi:RND family efflux transporter MFP subunit
MNALFAKRSATPQELDQAVAGLTSAEAQLASARSRAEAASAARQAALATVEADRVSVSYAVLSAPFDGIVVNRAIDPGAMAIPGAALLTVEDPASFQLQVQLDEARAAHAAIGQVVHFRLDERNPDNRWKTARVSEVARIDPATHSFLVKIDFAGGPTLQSGIFGRARFTGRAHRALTVPASALIRRGQLTFIFRVDQAGLARLLPISTGPIDTDRVELLAGAAAGDVVVVNPPVSLSDGARVNPESRAASAIERGAGQ